MVIFAFFFFLRGVFLEIGTVSLMLIFAYVSYGSFYWFFFGFDRFF